MRGKFVNFCMALLNLLLGISILVYSLKVPSEIIRLTVQEYNIVNVLKIVLYVGIGLTSLLNVIHYFLNDRDGMRKTGYMLALFSIAFIFIKQWPIALFNILASLMIAVATFRERWMETNSITAISIIGLIAIVIIVPIIGCFTYKTLGAYILKKENEKELAFKQDYFKYVTELDIHEPYINVKKDGKYGYINQAGNTVIDFKYDYASPFVNIRMNDKTFQVALVCEDGTSEIIMKNLRKVMTYRSESMDEDYEAKIREFKDIYYNTLGQTEDMTYEIDTDYDSKYRISAYEEQPEEGVTRYEYNENFDIEVSKSTLGYGDSYYLVGKNETYRLPLDCEKLDYDDKYLYVFKNGTIPYYDRSNNRQGWFTSEGTKVSLTGKGQILEIIGDKVLIKDHKDGSIYFMNQKNEKLSETYKEIFICDYDRFVVKNSKNKYMMIDSNFQKVFDSEWDFVDTSLAQVGVFTFGNVKDWEAQFNVYDFAENMNLTMIDYLGNVIQDNVQQVYNKYYYLENDDKKSKSEKYSDFLDNLRVMKVSYIGDEFYK